jgi:hypothetical protein
VPLYENYCQNCRTVREWYAPTSESPDPECCGQPTQRLISMFRVVFTGPISARYNDRSKENAHLEGFDAWRVHSAKDPRHPEKVRIETWEDRRKFMRDEHLEEVPSNATASYSGEGGRDVKISTVGMPGQWT